MATHSSILAERILWTEKPGGLLSIGSHRVGHNWSDSACMHAKEKAMATPSSVLAWRIPGMGEPDGLPSMGFPRVGHNWSDLAAAAAWALSHVRICATLWTAAHQAPPSIGFSRQEYWSEVPFPSSQQSRNGNNYTANMYHYVSGIAFSHLLFRVLLTALCHIIL